MGRNECPIFRRFGPKFTKFRRHVGEWL